MRKILKFQSQVKILGHFKNLRNFPECAKWTERTSNGSKFVDEDFDIDHPDNNQGNSCENGRWTRYFDVIW